MLELRGVKLLKIYANRDMIYDGTLTNFDKSMGGNESSIIVIALT